MNSINPSSKRSLTVFGLVMITIISVDSIRNLPVTALFGSALIFMYLISALCFLIPCALTAMELSSSWPEQGGVYVWVREAFGKPAGFLAIWFQWIENVIWYPTILSFVAGTLAFLINPQLASDKYFMISVILITFWSMTFLNLYGMKASSKFSSFCSVSGLIIPISIIIILGAVWVFTHRPEHLVFTAKAMLPQTHSADLWVSLTSIMLSFGGIEIATVHARDVKNPQKAFPKALIISAIIILTTLILGSLAIAMVVPKNQINLVAGIMQAYSTFFKAYDLHYVLPIIAVLLIIGTMGGVSNWIIAPTKGLLVAAEDGHLPKVLSKQNNFQAPTPLLILQAVLVSVLVSVFILMPSVNGSYWLLNVLASQLYMLMYILMLAAVIRLRYKAPNQKRNFKLPGGKLGVWGIAGLGIFSCIVTIIVGFIPPPGINVGGFVRYESLVFFGLLFMSTPPVIVYLLKKRNGNQENTVATSNS